MFTMAAVTHVGAATALAQFERTDRLVGFYLYTSGLDAYGNATAVSPLRREFDVYQSDAQSRALRLQNEGLRDQRRGGLIPFSLPGDRFRRTRDPIRREPLVPFVQDGQRRQSERVRAVRTYGGFGDRSEAEYQSDVQRAFARRSDLVTATASTAPVFRANLRHASVAGTLATIDATPFDERGTELAPEPSVDLREALTSEVGEMYSRTMRDAWGWFKDAEYRRAIRSFEAADVLASGDSTTRIGRIFSLISVGSYNAALTAVRALDRHDQNLFLNSIDVADILNDRQRVTALRLRTRMPSDAPRENPEVAGLHAFVLWYLGERQDALSVASAIAEESPNAVYAAWAEKMRAAAEANGLQ